MKLGNCLSWSECVQHIEDILYLVDSKYLEEALTDPKVHWDTSEESKVKKCAFETQFQGQSTLDDCVGKCGRLTSEKKRCMVNLACLYTIENLPLHMDTCKRCASTTMAI